MTRLKHPVRGARVEDGLTAQYDNDALLAALQPRRPRVVPYRLLITTRNNTIWALHDNSLVGCQQIVAARGC